MPDRNHDKDKQKHANNVVQFHLRKMEYQVKHPIRSKFKPYIIITLLLGSLALIYNLIFQQKPLQPIPLSKHEFNVGTNNHLEISISPNINGLYVIPATINRQRVNLIIDSGANGLSIPLAIAERAKLKKGGLITSSTAAGAIIEYTTVLPSLKIGRIHFKNLPASINPSMNIDGILMGTTVLEKFEITIKNKIMTLRCTQYVSC